MSARDQIRAMLDGLMGTARDGGRPQIDFDDPSVCKCFLLGCCPHDVLSGTRMSIGECAKLHDMALKADYEKANRKKNYYFEYDAVEQLRVFVNDADRRTEDQRRRLKETQEELSEEATIIADEIHRLGEEIGTKLAKAEQLGADGQVEQSLTLMSEVEELNKKKSAKEIDFRNCMPVSTYQQQKLRVCEVCSAYLGIHDNDRRLADHFGGKLHLGFITIRQKLDELEKRIEEMRNQPDDRVSPSRSRDRISRDRNGGSHNLDRSDRHSGSRHSGRHESSKHKRRRSRSRSRDRHSRSHRNRRSRSRS